MGPDGQFGPSGSLISFDLSSSQPGCPNRVRFPLPCLSSRAQAAPAVPPVFNPQRSDVRPSATVPTPWQPPPWFRRFFPTCEPYAAPITMFQSDPGAHSP